MVDCTAKLPLVRYPSNSKMTIDALKILDAMDQYVFYKDREGVYLYANEPFSRIAGVASPADIVGKRDCDLVWKQQAEHYEATDKAILAGKPCYRSEEIQDRANGSTRIIITRLPFRSECGNHIGILGNFFDCDNRLFLETTGSFDESKNRLHLEFVPEWLSVTEVRVCFYVIHGFSAQRIAEKTGTSVSTVRFHIENIKNKMQCDNKNEIAEVAMKTGIAWKIFTLQHVTNHLASDGYHVDEL